MRFQSTLPTRGETVDLQFFTPLDNYFNPLSPHGERRMGLVKAQTGFQFQSTLPAWGETVIMMATTVDVTNFNPLSPHGERLCDH